MYLNYWKLSKHPFNNVPDPDMYFQAHSHVDNAASELLFAIEEADECLAVIVGPVGVGKSMCLRIVLNALDTAKYHCAFVTNPDMTFAQLLREIIGQLQDRECTESRKEKLLEIFNSILFETSNSGRRVVIFIDEGNVIKAANLESLRLLTNMQDDHQNLLTIVLAGQPELGKRLEDPRRANLFQRIGVYCRIQGITSMETMRDYIEHRLERAGWSGESMFTRQAYQELWARSEGGVPRIINKICKLSLKAAESNDLKIIDGNIVKNVGDSFERVWRKIRTAGQPAAKQELPPAQLGIAAPDLNSTVHPAKEQEPHTISALGRKDRESLAERLATERINHLSFVTDPFEEWNKAREEILREIYEIEGDIPVKAIAV